MIDYTISLRKNVISLPQSLIQMIEIQQSYHIWQMNILSYFSSTDKINQMRFFRSQNSHDKLNVKVKYNSFDYLVESKSFNQQNTYKEYSISEIFISYSIRYHLKPIIRCPILKSCSRPQILVWINKIISLFILCLQINLNSPLLPLIFYLPIKTSSSHYKKTSNNF
ncbi:hypothetical protein pb186bvf_014597 [Paramecium bursaria]